MEYVLTARGLTKRYSHVAALNGLDMAVPKGAIYGLVGKNGAGKTTLIRLLCGLQRPTAGRYTLYGAGSGRSDMAKARRRMGAVVETPSLYPELTAEENLTIQYRVLGLPSNEGMADLLDLVGLAHTGRKKAKNFSLGMRQRLGIAVALAGDPDLLVLDEPVNGLDPQGIVEIRELVLRLNRERRITVLLSSHYLDELARLATWYGFIDGGRMVRELSARELNAALRRRTRIRVTDTGALARALDAAGAEYRIVSPQEADIFAKVDVSALALALAEDHCRILSIKELDESLESYYISLVGGERDA